MVSKIVKSPKLKRAASSHIFELDDLDVGNKARAVLDVCGAVSRIVAPLSATSMDERVG